MTPKRLLGGAGFYLLFAFLAANANAQTQIKARAMLMVDTSGSMVWHFGDCSTTGGDGGSPALFCDNNIGTAFTCAANTSCTAANGAQQLFPTTIANPSRLYAAKAALNSLTANLRMDLQQYPGIHISLVMPGVVTTDFARNVRGEPRPPINAGAPGSSPMKTQSAEEVAEKISGLIAHPVAELYTNPASAAIAQRYYANQGEQDVSTR